jgi:hypothetical protein
LRAQSERLSPLQSGPEPAGMSPPSKARRTCRSRCLSAIVHLRERADKPDSVGERHLSSRPTQRLGRAVLKRLPIWPCSDQGLPSRSGRPDRWWSLTPPFHPCLCRTRPSAVFSLLHFPKVAPAEVSSVACPAESGLSSGRPASTPASGVSLALSRSFLSPRLTERQYTRSAARPVAPERNRSSQRTAPSGSAEKGETRHEL